jgi:hypothetical protein
VFAIKASVNSLVNSLIGSIEVLQFARLVLAGVLQFVRLLINAFFAFNLFN